MTHQVFARTGLVVAMLGLLSLSACSGLDNTEESVLSGGAIGAAVGTVGVLMTGGCIPCGTAIGSAVGAGAGYAIERARR